MDLVQPSVTNIVADLSGLGYFAI